MIEIKRASISDVQTLTELGRKTFVETFSKFNRQEDMDLYVADAFSTEKQLQEITDPNRIIEIAWINDQAAGFLHLLKGKADPSVAGDSPLEILRLYVDSAWHGKGIGAALMEKTMHIAREANFQTLWLGVWENNFRAQAFYKKYGFEVSGQHIFRLGTDNQTDLIMSRAL